MRRTVLSAAAAAAILLMAVPAAAHVTVQPTEELAGSFARFVVRVPNERDGASTNRVEVQFPPLAFVSFQDVPGWERTVEMQTLDEPLEVFGEQITETVGTVTWSGGEIEPGEFQEFGFSARMPDEATTLEFPAIQTYDSGEVVRWIGPPDSEEPAALLASVDLGGGEEQGQLAVLAELVRRSRAEPDGGADSGVLLGWIAIALAVAALAVALLRRRG
jgi:uncharacterized protein YcnI